MSHFDYELTPPGPIVSDAHRSTHDVIVSDGSTVTITLEDGFSDLPDELTDIEGWKNVSFKLIDFEAGELPAAFPHDHPEGTLCSAG